MDDPLYRIHFLESMIGKRWKANAKGPDEYDCWHCACRIQSELFGVEAPAIEVPEDPSWPWIIQQFATHQELTRWVERLQMGPKVTAQDGALVLMARNKHPAHIGVWLDLEESIIHCDVGIGVVFEGISTIRANGWSKLKFYELRA